MGQSRVAAQGRFETTEDSLFTQFTKPGKQSYDRNAPYYVVTWEGKTPDSLAVVRNVSEHVAIIRLNSHEYFTAAGRQVRIAPANDSWKLARPLETLIKAGNGSQKYVVTGPDVDSLLEVLQRKKDVSILSIHRPANSVVIRCRAASVSDYILGLKEVIFINTFSSPGPEANIIGYDRSFHGINAIDFLLPSANGKNIVVGVKEQRMEDTDIDLWKRILPSSLASPVTSDHATVIASIIGGAGNSSYYGRGIAWRCTFFPSSYSNLFADDAAVLNANKVSVQNHSYGTVIEQFYGPEAVSYDALAWGNKNLIPVMSAGNQGLSSASEGKYANIPGYANITGNFKMAKNIITVGAIDNKDIIPPLSSSGPLYDGRLAPQLTALGPNGTSDAAAILSGTIAVMQQVYADSNNTALPPASLIRSVLYNTATDIYTTGIDYKTGYGLLNSYAAIRAIQQKKYDGGSLVNGQVWIKNISVPPGIAEVRLTLAWTDSAATVNNNRALVNDLDLELMELSSGIVYRPWVLNNIANKDSLAKAPVRKRDSLNTAEQVSIRLPDPGIYQLKVTGSIPASSIPFHVSWNMDTLNTFRFTNPLHASDVNRQESENLSIRWTTFIADTTLTGNLFASYDNGVSWQSIGQSIKLAAGKYQWKIKDTSSYAILKMETPFGVFVSGKFVIAPWTRISVDFNCTDSFRISWNKHIDAASYRIYALTDSPYLKNILAVADTFLVLQNISFPSRVYAVEPVLNSGIAAARSQALNIDLQAVHCFYRTLNYTLYDTNKLELELQLSIADYADSIFFERVTQGGGLLNVYGIQKAGAGVLAYTQFIGDVPEGTIYLRARIKLKNGASVYTEIVAVTTSGKNYITFYPNPAGKATSLNVVLQQGVSTNSKLCIYDISGRLLCNFGYVPYTIDVSRLPAGIFIYRLLDEENRVLQTGKLVIR